MTKSRPNCRRNAGTNLPDFSLWLAGFFVTRAQHSVVAVVDKSINAILMSLSKGKEQQLREYAAIYADFSTRLGIITHRAWNTSLQCVTRALAKGFALRKGGETPYLLLPLYDCSVLPDTFVMRNELYDPATWSVEITEFAAECVANCVDVTNDWKHLPGPSPRGEGSRRALICRAWLATYLALLLALRFLEVGMHSLVEGEVPASNPAPHPTDSGSG